MNAGKDLWLGHQKKSARQGKVSAALRSQVCGQGVKDDVVEETHEGERGRREDGGGQGTNPALRTHAEFRLYFECDLLGSFQQESNMILV